MPLATRDDAAAVLTVDDAFFTALRTADTAALGDLLDPEFLLVDIASGGVASAEQFAALLGSGQLVVDELTPHHEEAVVRRFGTTAVVVGRTTMRLRLPDGQPLEVASRYTHVFAPDATGRWRLASAQGTQIATP